MKETLDLVNQFGFPLVAAGGLVYTIIHLRKQHQDERRAWDEERKKLYETAIASRDARVADHDKLGERLIKSHEISMNIINKTSDIAATLENQCKEIKDAREHELRTLHTTGSNPRDRR